MSKRIFWLIGVLIFQDVLHADIRYWEATLPGGTFTVSTTEIVSVSMHDYYVDGVGMVSEVTLDTHGNVTARFYAVLSSTTGIAGGAVETATQTLDRLKKSAESVSGVKGADPKTSVIKTYPTTTHAHTVEYRLADKDELEALFKSARSSLITGASGSYKVKE